MRLTNRDRLNLARFGCTFLPKQDLICITWQQEQQNARSANILARLIYVKFASGPLLSLAFEISRTKVLAQYCFLPFDLRNKAHTKYLSSVLKNGKIELAFLADSGRIMRIYELPPRQCANMAELYATAIADSKTFPAEEYEFDRAVAEFEQNLRLVDYFQYVVTDSELQLVIASSKEEASKVAPENRAQAAKIASELLGVFRPQYDVFVREVIKKGPSLRRTFLFCLDLHKQFEDDYEGFAQFLADVIAARTPKEDNKELETATLLFKSIFKLMDHMKEASTRSGETSSAQLESDFREVMARLAWRSGALR